jgi:hypothetical protein
MTMTEGICKNCKGALAIDAWGKSICPTCGRTTKTKTNNLEQQNNTIDNTTNPSIIALLSTLGWALFAMTGLSGLFLTSQDGGGILGVSLIIAGVFQLSIFLGFSAIIDQLYQINVNTSKPDKSDS